MTEIKYEVTVNEDGTSWRLNGVLHRIGGPAFEWANGDKWWRLDGKIHREDGPAVELADGGKSWFLNDELHREDGPAVMREDGYELWYLNGKKYTKAAHKKEMAKRNKPSCDGTVVEIDGKKYTLKAVK
jgi:hypothetical protein